MAELAGLVIGGVALASLFDTCMNTFAHLDAGKNCGRDYQEAALKISLLGARLGRWEETYRTSAPSSRPRDGILAEAALESINENLKGLFKTAQRYESTKSSNAVAKVTDKLQTLTISRVKTRLGAKIVWALHEKEAVERVISTVRFKIEELEAFSKSLAPVFRERAMREAEEVILPSEIEEPDTTVPTVMASAAAVDPCFGEGIKEVKTSSGHNFLELTIGDKARVHNGNQVHSGYQGSFTGQQHTFHKVKVMDEARTHNGDVYGGKVVSIWDD